MQPSLEDKLVAENARLQSQLAGLKELLTQEIAAKSSLESSRVAQAQRYLELTERAPWVVTRIGSNGCYVDANTSFTTLMGARLEDVLDQEVGSCGEPMAWTDALLSFLHTPDELESEVRIALHDSTGKRVFLTLMARSSPGREFNVLAFDQTEQIEALESARRASAAKSQFLAVMSHAIRTPMNGVLGPCTLLDDTELSFLQESLVRTISQSGELLAEVIDDVIELSMEQDAPSRRPSSTFPSREELRDAVTHARAADIEERFQISQRVDESVPTELRGDPDRIRKTIVHVVRDCLEQSPSGSLDIVFSFEESVDGQGELVIEFESSSPRSADPAPFKGNQSMDMASGMGLGLTLANGFARSIDGRIIIDPAGQEGLSDHKINVLTARLPAAKVASVARSATSERADPLVAGMRVLLAEDNPVNRRVAEGLLRRAGFVVSSVDDGDVAIDALRESEFDLVLMDVDMPRLNGIDATREVRRMERHAELKGRRLIFALTANAVGGSREACLEAGMDEHLSKPFRPAALLRLLQQNAQTRP